MAAELTKVYRTADGRLFEKSDRDVARAHDAWLELVAWLTKNVPTESHAMAGNEAAEVDILAHAVAKSPELLAILKRKPQQAKPA